MASIELDKASKQYPNGAYGVRQIDLDISDGEFVVFLGPSGCGKSTTLRMIAGLEGVTSGDIRIGGKSMIGVAPRDRNIAVVFQSYALYPHMSVHQNLAFGLRIRGIDKPVINEKIAFAANLLGLQKLLDRKPAALSGGQRQRVALGRAIVRDPAAFLFDEPLSNLDAQLRADMRLELIKLHRRLGRTIVHVTHDQVEAMTMGDRICIMRDGLLVQAGKPLDVYANPINTFVAEFLATPPMNLISASLHAAATDRLAVVADSGPSFDVPDRHDASYRQYADRGIILGIRAEDFHERRESPAWQQVSLRVIAIEALGAESIVVGELVGRGADTAPLTNTTPSPETDGKPIEVSARLSRYFSAPIGSVVDLFVDLLPMHLFDRDTGLAIARPRLEGRPQ